MRRGCLFVVACVLLVPEVRAGDSWDRIVERDLRWIISSRERKRYRSLKSAEQKEKFLEQFWKRRDPTPGTAANEYREEHYRRLAFVREHFKGEGIPAWRTERARVYIIHGPPQSRSIEKDREIWVYPALEGLGGERRAAQLVFAKPAGVVPSDVGPERMLKTLKSAQNTGVVARYRLVGVTRPGDPAALSDERSLAALLRSPGDLLEEAQARALKRRRTLEEVRTRIRSNVSYRRAPIRLQAWRLWVREGPAVLVAGEIPPGAWGARPGHGKEKAGQVDVSCRLAHPGSGEILDRFETTLPIDPGGRVGFHDWFRLPQAAEIECLAYQAATSRAAYGRLPVSPGAPGRRIELSDLLLTRKVEAGAGSGPADLATVRFLPDPAREFRASEPLFLYFQVMDHRPPPAPPLLFDYQIRGLNRIVHRSGMRPLEKPVGGRAFAAQALRLNLAVLEPGAYTLDLKVMDREGHYTIGRVSFSLLRGP